jgi:GNAT superfamily N-acetyltransferase
LLAGAAHASGPPLTWYLCAMGDAADVTLAVEPADSAASVALQAAFFADIASRYPGWEPGAAASADPASLAPPAGAWVVAYLAGRPVGCGGLQRVDAETGEIRRIYIDGSARGRGIGRSLLAELELRARRAGYVRLRLTTGDGQPEALGLFRSTGYREVAPFTTGAFTRFWLAKPLDRT